jgi:hypothetical protein
MAADQPDRTTGGDVHDRNDGRLHIVPLAAQREAMANPDLCSFCETGAEGFADGSGVFPAHAVGDVHLPNIFRRDEKMGLERRIDPLIDKAPPRRRAYYEEKIG